MVWTEIVKEWVVLVATIKLTQEWSQERSQKKGGVGLNEIAVVRW